MTRRRHKIILLLGDLLALALFVYAGQRDHDIVDPSNPVGGVLATTLEFAVPWIVAGWLLGAFPEIEGLSFRAVVFRALNAWLVASPIALVVRALILGRTIIPPLFIVVTLVMGGLFVLAWRVIFMLGWRAITRGAK